MIPTITLSEKAYAQRTFSGRWVLADGSSELVVWTAEEAEAFVAAFLADKFQPARLDTLDAEHAKQRDAA